MLEYLGGKIIITPFLKENIQISLTKTRMTNTYSTENECPLTQTTNKPANSLQKFEFKLKNSWPQIALGYKKDAGTVRNFDTKKVVVQSPIFFPHVYEFLAFWIKR